MAQAIDKAKLKGCVMTIISRKNAANQEGLQNLQKILYAADPKKNGVLSHEDFSKALEDSKFALSKYELAEVIKELDPKESGMVMYTDFTGALFLSQLFLKEYKLYDLMKQYDTEGKGGVTIGMLNEILISNE